MNYMDIENEMNITTNKLSTKSYWTLKLLALKTGGKGFILRNYFNIMRYFHYSHIEY